MPYILPRQGFLVSAFLEGDSLYLSANNMAGRDTIMVTAVDDSNAAFSDTFVVQVRDATALEDLPVPAKYSLDQNYPNPFNPTTTITFQIPHPNLTTLKIYNVLGKEVATIVSEKMNPGNYSYTFDGSSLATGVYYYRLEITGK